MIDTALAHSRTVVLSLILVLITGWAAYHGIPKEADPDVEIPHVYVRLTHEGISPEDAERLLIRPMEQELRALEGIKELSAEAYEGGASINLEFEAGIDTDLALQDVREQVDLAQAKLPAETEEPRVSEVKLAKWDPMMVLNVSGSLPERTLVNLARDLKDKIEGVAGVLEVDIRGDREEVLEVIVDPLALESYGLSQSSLFQLVDRNNRLVAAGALDSGKGRFPVKVPGVFENAADVLSLPVKVDGDSVVHFGDVASVRRTFKDAQSYARINGEPAIGLEIVKRAGANIIDTVEAVNAIVAEEMIAWPDGVNVVVSKDKSEDIRTMLSDLQNNVLSAVLLVFVVIIGILGFRSALLVGIAIPGSFLAAMLLLQLTGLTVNIVVLFSLIMAVGMLVDGAIVVTELADRKMHEGLHRRKAYAIAAKRMARPIITSTLTTLAAFFPLLFWPGIVGEFMKYLPITLIATLAASLVMALVFVPTLGSLFGKPGTASTDAIAHLTAAEAGNLTAIPGFTGRYVRVLEAAVGHPWRVVGGVTAALVGVFVAYGLFGRGVEFFPDVEPTFSTLQIRARGDLSVEEMDAIVREVEQRILPMQAEFDSVYARSGRGSQDDEDLVGSIQLQFVDWQHRRPAAEILAEVRERNAELAGVVVETRSPRAGPGADKPIVIEVAARDPALLGASVDQIRAAMQQVGGLQDVEDNRPLPGIEWRIEVDRAQAARFGADVALVGNTVQLVTNGIKLGEYRPDDADEELDIRVRYPIGERRLDQLDELRIPTEQGSIPISNFVQRVPAQKVGTLQRTDLKRTMTIAADVQPGVLINDKVTELRALLPEIGLDPRISLRFKGDDEDQREAEDFLKKALLIALFIIGILLVTEFNSLYQAMLILTAVLFSTGGALLGHVIMGKPFSIVMSGVGIIALAGIVVNNNIVLIDTYNHLRRQGLEPREAVLRTGAQRLRPVLLTTITTILGLLPMVLGINLNLIDRDILLGGPTTQWWIQLSSSVAYGLAFATVLTLLLSPSLLMIQANLAERWQGWRLGRAAAAPDGRPAQ